MARAYQRAWVFGALLTLASACGVDLDDHPGRACDDSHPCITGRACVVGVCVAVDAGSSGDGGRDAGTGHDGGSSDAGTGVTWQQRLDGFTSRTEAPGCTADIDPSLGNRVLAIVTADAGDVATADLTGAAHFPSGTAGRLRGKLSLPARVNVSATTPVVRLGASKAWVEVGFTPPGSLYVRSSSTTIATNSLTETFTRDGGFGPGDLVVDVAWEQGVGRAVSLDGLRVAGTVVTGGDAGPPGLLRLGVLTTGDAGDPFSVTLSAFQLGDSPDAAFGALP